ncbi:nucleotidyl transferase AbiEii/AbiGii toxin family protein [Pricia sp.]|uniref:nucleotidyl transferase AbiEii/AbiGii toxin family protein n=1 Tax=Pricia sp. TaxID=2268138 RepID=UPI003593C33D
MKNWQDEMYNFIGLCNKHRVRMLLVGGGAVNFHGYQRYSNDLDFWLDTTTRNFEKLVLVFKAMDYEIEDFPEEVKQGRQNISVKFAPLDLNLELITNFSVGESFEDAYKKSETASRNEGFELSWRVLSLEHLIASKIKSGRPKDLSDVHELQRRKKDST